MAGGGLGYTFKDGDWTRLRQIIQQISSVRLGYNSTPTFDGATITNNLTVGGSLSLTGTLTLSSLTASRLTATNASQQLVSSDISSWIAGTTNQITVTDDLDGTATLSLPQNIHTGASPTFTGLTLSGLTATRIPYVGVGGLIQDSANLTFDGTNLTCLGSVTGSSLVSSTGGCNIAASQAYTINNVNAINLTGTNIVKIGSLALRDLTSGVDSVGIGTQAGLLITTGSSNLAIGAGAMARTSVGINNTVAIGTDACRRKTGDGNIAIGKQAMGVDVAGTYAGEQNVGIGNAAFYNITSGSYSVAIGAAAGTTNTTGTQNTYIGGYSGYSNLSGGNNIFIGYKSGYYQTTNSNLFIVDNQGRGSVGSPTDSTKALIYGVMNATETSQTLQFNAAVGISGLITATGGISIPTTEDIQFRDAAITIASLDDGHLDLTADTSIDLNTPTVILQSVLESPKSKLTAIGGYAVKLTNKTGGNTVAGQLVKADTATNDAAILTGSADTECIGVFLDDGIADSAEAWVVVSGIADVAFDDNVSAVRGDWVSTGATGYAATATSPAAAPTHFEEIGHCVESVAAGGAGTHILARCILHFN